jgi:hypothetical protein
MTISDAAEHDTHPPQERPVAIPAHDKAMAGRFLAGLDPKAAKFTFQFFVDCGVGRTQIFHGTLDEVWPKVLALNTTEHGVGVFVNISETDFKGRKAENIIRPRALFADADSKGQAEQCIAIFEACSVQPSMAVSSGRGYHFYFCTELPLDQFSEMQKRLIAKLGTDPAVKDLSRVMRLPGTLHLKDPTRPRPVKLLGSPNAAVRRWQLPDLVSQLGLSPLAATPPKDNVVPFKPSELSPHSKAEASNVLSSDDILVTGPEDVEKIRSAVMAISSSAISTEPEWVKLARALAHEAARFPEQRDELERILDEASRQAEGYDKEENQERFQRYIDGASDRETPITIATLFYTAQEHGWEGWSPPIVPTPVNWSPSDFQVSFTDIPHRRWLYGVDLVRGDITLIGSPGGAGKTSLAIGIAVAIATGRRLLEEKIFGEDLRVVYINAEDGGVEMQRRTWAFCLKHNIAEQDLIRLSLAGTDDPRVQRLSFLRTIDKYSAVDQDGFNQLEGLLAALKPDLLVLDPLIALCGGGNVNDNAAMSLVMREIKRLAIIYDCAVLIILHTKKGGDLTSAEAISGASAIVNLARHAIMIVPMTEDEATKLGVLPSERHRYLKAVDAKSNLAPRSGDTPWYELCSEELPNAEPPIYLNGDRVQAIARVNLAHLSSTTPATDDPKIRRAVLDLVDRGKIIDGQAYPYSPATSGAQNQRALLDDAIDAVKNVVDSQISHNDLRFITERAITKMKSEGWLVEESISNKKRFRRGRGLRVDWSRTLWSKPTSSEARDSN